ncbi:MAG: hypothetical protein R3E39_00210 [Anaerolineae bacterium]
MIRAFVDQISALLAQHPFQDDDQLWATLRRLLRAHAPSGGAWLPGAIVDDIQAVCVDMGFGDHFVRQIGATGNAGMAFGADKAVADIIILAHMDRPTYRVRSVNDGLLYPMCATRFPTSEYRVGAKALRFIDGRMQVSARGILVTEDGGKTVSLQVTEGELAWHDTVTMDVEPTLEDGQIQGTGLDNCLGVVSALGLAIVLGRIESELVTADRRCLLVFTDQEEGVPEAYFGHGAARLAYAALPPSVGCIIVDAQNVSDALKPGAGVGHGTVSAWSRGSVVPPNLIALALDLSEAVNEKHPNTVQMNTGYLSRSDDMPLGRWSQILGMIGAPLLEPHTGEERADLSDVRCAYQWLSYFALAAIGLDAQTSHAYALNY